jgi:hypothetical protein
MRRLYAQKVVTAFQISQQAIKKERQNIDTVLGKNHLYML